ncbi:MAG: hypothetical protein ABIV28_07630 [Longimicrobiales bacterium]
MRNVMRSAAMVATSIPLLLAARPASAQYAGVWEATSPAAIRNENGVETPTGSVTITITIEQRGDSVFATWQRGAIEGRPDMPARQLKGIVKDGQILLDGGPQEAKMMRNGEEEVIRLTSSYALKLQSDELAGTATVTNEADGSVLSERPFSAKRKKA